ncbi:MAG: hypothetical protein WCF33_17215, partial [Pseudonocardiaceae bacterium]
ARHSATGARGFPLSRWRSRQVRLRHARDVADLCRRCGEWEDAVADIGRSGLHFHNLRCTGNTRTAQTYANAKDLMVRMGQDSPHVALTY